ncbi:hypothetical protein EJ02DRAFT_426137 [Clathrospora elynae]|uniref:Uncharacterized protein n=1 Tax=Clathrospora elynae TaxID=706981 RepID=A0A6A5SBJ4_9PLEO|nr:hypothetical protein EJ02DRAFT_426137 [Clathrospora elynae]
METTHNELRSTHAPRDNQQSACNKAMSPSVTSGSLLPASLHTIYQTCKNCAVTLINWIILRGIGRITTGNTKPTRLAVRRIVELAEKIAQRLIPPPKSIKDAFNIVLVNRSPLTRYYGEN